MENNNGQSPSLGDHMASAFPEGIGGDGSGAPNLDSQTDAPQQQQQSQSDPVDAFFGAEPSKTPDGDGEGTPSSSDGKIELAIDPDTVVGKTADGKPVTAAEVQRSFLREADYTRKTMDIADVRKKAETYDAFVQENGAILADLDSGDEARVMRGLQQIAQARGVQFPAASDGVPRGPDGRFTSRQGEPQFSAIDLDDFVPGTVEYQMAETINHLVDLNQRNPQVAALEAKLAQQEQFFNSLNQGLQESQVRSEMESLAGWWASEQQFKDADVDGAMKMVGQPINPAQAMQLHHMSKYMKHMLNIARGNTTPPDVFGEPAAGGSAPVNPSGTSLTGYMQRIFGG